jgi:hypothetical protein
MLDAINSSPDGHLDPRVTEVCADPFAFLMGNFGRCLHLIKEKMGYLHALSNTRSDHITMATADT